MVIKNRMESIFKYMRELNDIRNPVDLDLESVEWKLYVEDLPDIDEITSIFKSDEDMGVIMKVIRPKHIPCAKPPESIRDWIKGNWEQFDKAIEKIESKEKLVDGENVEIYFDDVQGRISDFQNWNQIREVWRREEKLRDKGRRIYSVLFSLYSKLQKQSEDFEIVIGDAFLKWRTEEGLKINHPILLQKIRLDFNPHEPSFSLLYEDGTSEIYTSLFRKLTDVSNKALVELIDENARECYQVHDKYETSEYLERFIKSVNDKGEYCEVEPLEASADIPKMYRKPVLFIRKRKFGYAIMIDSIVEDIQEREDFPNFFKQIAGVYQETAENEAHTRELNINGFDEDVLLGKPANREQLFVAKNLERHGAVLVQGPPGTGKTHTIANIIGHLLSEGKSILVTSHTEKALSVLKEKVQESIQNLCLSVTGSREGRKEMEASLNEINQKRSLLNSNSVENEIKAIASERKRILSELERVKSDLFTARRGEYEDIVIAGEACSPIDAAKFVSKHKELLEVIPSPVELGEPLPLNSEQLKDLYLTNEYVSREEEKELLNELPPTETLLTKESVGELFIVKKSNHESVGEWSASFWASSVTDFENLESIQKSILEMSNKIIRIDEFEKELISSGIGKGADIAVWETLFERLGALVIRFAGMRNVLLDNEIKIPNDFLNEEHMEIVQKIIEALLKKDRISPIALLMNPKWKIIIDNVSINGSKLKSASDFELVRDYMSFMMDKNSFIQRWNRQVNDKYKLEDDVELSICELHAEKFKQWIAWHEDSFKQMKNQLCELGFKWETYEAAFEKPISKYAELEKFIDIISNGLLVEIDKFISYCRYLDASSEIKDNLNLLRNYLDEKNIVIQKLCKAFEEEDAPAYSVAYDEFVMLKNKSDIVRRRQEYISKINQIAPAWAELVRDREGVHGLRTPPEDIASAWKCRQYNDELKRRHKLDIQDLQKKIVALEERMRAQTKDLVDKQAWLKTIQKMGPEQIQAIEGWRLLMKRIGRGTGRNAKKYQAEARNLMPTCQKSIPVWIMPLNKVVESFNPRQNRFDVVIIDEASQSDIMALNALYMANQVIIVGDDEQVSPSAVGQKIDEVNNLIEMHLEDIPNAILYTGDASVYDLARMSGFTPITLIEHFRCLSPIIQFSNYLSYNGKILPLRDEGNVQIHPPVVEHRVKGKTDTIKKINVAEAREIVSIILAMTETEDYNNKTLGVISLLGEEQAAYIDNMLQEKMSPVEYIQRRIQCGNSASFQGDERDVIILSVVDSPDEKGPLNLRSPEANNDRFKKRYNVAASRARDQMWVVHSLNPGIDLKDGDIRKRIIYHAKNPYAFETEEQNVLHLADSPFEQEVLSALIQKGFKVKSQWKVGAYRIDIVVIGDGQKLAIECDGERWHTPDKLQEDMNRQAILERLGWTFERIRGSEFYADKQATMTRVIERLESMGITPILQREAEEYDMDTSIVENVRIKAAEIRRSWEEDEMVNV